MTNHLPRVCSLLSDKRSVIRCQILVFFQLFSNFTAAALLAQGNELSPCFRASLSNELPYVTSGVVLNGEALVVEAFKEGALRVDKRGRIQPLKLVEEMHQKSGLEDSSPIWSAFQAHSIKKLNRSKHFVLFGQVAHRAWHTQPWFKIVEYDQNLANPKRIQLPDYTRMLLVDFEPIDSGRSFLLYGKFREESGDDSTFLYLDTDLEKEITKTYRPLATIEGEFSDVEHSYYLYMNVDFMASIDKKVFILFYRRSGASIGMFEIDDEGIPGDLTQVDAPEDFRETHFPKNEEFPYFKAGDRASYILQSVVELKPMAMGLYVWNKRLFLLAKNPISKNGETKWWLISLNPDTGSEISRFEIPSDAAHISVITGNDYWRFIEKSQVYLVGKHKDPYMRTTTMVLMPSEWLNESPKRKGLFNQLCERVR